MPPYAFLAEKELNYGDISKRLKTERLVGVPYTDDMILYAELDLRMQGMAESFEFFDAQDALKKRYNDEAGREGTVLVEEFDGDPAQLTEMDALVAYLQMIGTLVDFSVYEADDLDNRR